MTHLKHHASAAHRMLVMGSILLLALLLPAASADAKKTHLFLETFGSAATPTFSGASSLAVDQSSGDLLVLDAAAKTISRFKSNGEPDPFPALGTNVIDAKKGAGGKPCAEEPSSCDQTPQEGFTVGSVAGEVQIAIDESGTATDGDIYVTQGYQARGNLIEIFAADGEYLGQLTGAGATGFGTTGSFPFSPCGVAVDASGNLFVAGGYDKKIYKFASQGAPHNPLVNNDIIETFSTAETTCNLAAGAGPTAGALFANTFFTIQGNSVLKLSGAGGGLQYVVDPGESRLVATNPVSGHLYTRGVTDTVNEYDASGASPTLLSSFEGPFNSRGIAVDGASGKIYMSAGNDEVRVYSPLVSVPDVTTGAATITGDTSVTLNGTVNPDGDLLEECRFEYGTATTPYEHSEPCAESPAEIGTGTKAVHLDLGGLDPETLYHYRLVAKNVNATIEGADRTLKTPSKPAIVAQWATSVSTDSAVVKATINPENAETSYRFEWGTEAPYSHQTIEKTLAVGRDNEEHTVSLSLHDLAPETTYHYRVIATNNIGIGEGDDHAFTTFALPSEAETNCPNQAFRSGRSAALADCRAYEMVSPLDKNNGDIRTLYNFFGLTTHLNQSATDGSGFTYSSYRAFANPKSAPYTNQLLARRGAQGWQTESMVPAGDPSKFRELLENPFKAFSPDLQSAWFTWLTPTGEPAPDPCGPFEATSLYRRDNVDDAFRALSCVQPILKTQAYTPEIQGFSADGSRAVFRADEVLTSDASGAKVASGFRPINQLYESSATGPLRLVSVLPNGEASGLDSTAGTTGEWEPDAYWVNNRRGSLEHAVSEDGTRVFWSFRGPSGQSPLYLRTNADQPQSKIQNGDECTQPTRACTLAVSETVTPEPSYFQTANPQGTRALFIVSSGPLEGNLYRFDAEAEPPASELIATRVMGHILGTSDDLAQIYFASEEATAPQQAEGAVEGEPNVYLYDGGTTRFVATLSGDGQASDVSNPYGTPMGLDPTHRPARASADGASLVFMSNSLELSEQTAGYDNTDAASGRPDAEVYLYDATAAGGELHCVSCNPSGARPVGREFLGGNDEARLSAAATVPGFESQLYQPRYLSEDGKRVFFNSYEALVVGDTNGKQDVYQWEAPGTGRCSKENPTYVAGSEGCLSLISSGQSPADSEFLDANVSGSDVFFTTAEGLLPQDYGLIDVYDARIDGGFPPPAGQPVACDGEACQGSREAPNDPTPASAAFDGPGNLGKAVKGRCAKGKARRKGRCVANKHKAKKRHHRRANHDRRTAR